nr:DUF4253 domain-containing protein [Dactylosporangium thailandense]
MRISDSLPPGRLVGEQRRLWVSTGPATAALFDELRRAHPHAGQWPLLLDHRYNEPGRPWDDGEIGLCEMTDPAGHDPEAYLAGEWARYAKPPVTEPFTAWPGLAPTGRPQDPLGHAAACAAEILAAQPHLRLGLVETARPADAITAFAWAGPLNYSNDMAPLSAVLRSWEERFGAYVVGVGFDTLHLSVAAPPATVEEALPVAAEHFAFCPDDVWQREHPQTVAALAEELVGVPMWSFWWD